MRLFKSKSNVSISQNNKYGFIEQYKNINYLFIKCIVTKIKIHLLRSFIVDV